MFISCVANAFRITNLKTNIRVTIDINQGCLNWFYPVINIQAWNTNTSNMFAPSPEGDSTGKLSGVMEIVSLISLKMLVPEARNRI